MKALDLFTLASCTLLGIAGLCGFVVRPATIDVPIIVTATSSYDELAVLKGGERFAEGAQLLRIDNGKASPLVEGFSASADADVSFDATRMLFSGRKSAGDPWQIWELSLADKSVRPVLTSTSSLERPLYLPDGRFLYARLEQNRFQIQIANLDGTHGFSLTHVPSNVFPSTVLRDGRILFEAGYPLNSGDTPELYLVYSDGSGLESYRCDHGSARWGGAQLASGDLVFSHGSSLARFTSPLAAETSMHAPSATYTGQFAQTADGKLLVSAKPSRDAHYAIRLWNPGSPASHEIYSSATLDIVSPVLLTARPTPNRHPSALHDWPTANLLALDVRQSRSGPLHAAPAYVQIEIQDKEGRARIVGRAPVEEDGSFFVKVTGDRPTRFALLDAQGQVVRREEGWFWSRGGEQRICVGCHAGPERAPDNRVPAVLLRTTTPVDLSALAASPGGY